MASEKSSLVRYNEIDYITVGTVAASTSLDADGAKAFGDDVVTYLDAHPGTKLLLNFQNITYLSSAALGELLRVNTKAKETKSAVQLCGLSKEINKVFEITNLANLFKVDPDEDIEKTIMRLDTDGEWEVYPG